MKVCDFFITAEYVLTQNETRDIIHKGALAITEAKIEAVGLRNELEQQYQPVTRRDFGNALVMPGLVNAHTHAPMTLLRGMADDLPLMEWLNKHIFPLEAKLTPHMLEIGSMLACAEMLRTGTTACTDMYMHERHVFKSINKSGMKAMVGEGIFDVPTLEHGKPTRSFELVQEHIDEIKDYSRIRYAVMPHSVYTTNRSLLETCAALSDELGIPIHMHAAETTDETSHCIDRYGCRPIELCVQTGLLKQGTSLAHGVDLTDEEIPLLAEKGVSVIHCPRSNMKLSSGVSPLPQLFTKGINVALGTDGASSNNMLNMFSEMTATALLHKVQTKDPTVLPATTILDMATINGGKAIGWTELGKLVSGGPADIIALDLNQPNMVPMSNVMSHIVYAATGHEVFFTMVDGNILYERGNFLHIDYLALAKEAQEIREWLVADL